MTHPRLFVTVDGVPVSGAFFDRLVSLTITDREGIRSDTLDLVFDDSPPHFQSPLQGRGFRSRSTVFLPVPL